MPRHIVTNGGEQYVPFGLKQIKTLRATGLKYATQTFDMPDGRVVVKIVGDQEYVTTSGGGGTFWILVNVVEEHIWSLGKTTRTASRLYRLAVKTGKTRINEAPPDRRKVLAGSAKLHYKGGSTRTTNSTETVSDLPGDYNYLSQTVTTDVFDVVDGRERGAITTPDFGSSTFASYGESAAFITKKDERSSSWTVHSGITTTTDTKLSLITVTSTLHIGGGSRTWTHSTIDNSTTINQGVPSVTYSDTGNELIACWATGHKFARVVITAAPSYSDTEYRIPSDYLSKAPVPTDASMVWADATDAIKVIELPPPATVNTAMFVPLSPTSYICGAIHPLEVVDGTPGDAFFRAWRFEYRTYPTAENPPIVLDLRELPGIKDDLLFLTALNADYTSMTAWPDVEYGGPGRFAKTAATLHGQITTADSIGPQDYTTRSIHISMQADRSKSADIRNLAGTPI